MKNMVQQKNRKDLTIVMASDEKYLAYLEIAVKSIRKHNTSIPIKIFSCSPISFLETVNKKVVKVQVKPPKGLRSHLESTSAYNHALTRIAKLASMTNVESENILYLDSDIIALTDIEKISEELETNRNTIYLLLRRPQSISLLDIAWLYFKNSTQMTTEEMTEVVNDTFSTNYSSKSLLRLNCWNGGIVYGSGIAVKRLAEQWRQNYIKMLTGKNRDSFIPNDQLCLWITVDQLKNKIDFKELPLSWNFMPGHAVEDLVKNPNPSPDEIKKTLKAVNILHLAQNKTDVWAQILINEISSM
jgi:lipopolysaccharide biosynthesis glycosyltransferase